MRTTFIPIIFLFVFTLGLSQDQPTRPKIYLYAETLTTEYLGSGFTSLPELNAFTLLHEDSDMAGDAQLISALNTLKAYCVDGVWRFFPEKDFLATPVSDRNVNGITLGLGQYRYCKNAGAGAGADLASMKSYRYLGPVNWAVEYSMTVYEGYHFAGKNIAVVKELSDTPDTNIVNIDFDVKSFVITAPIKDGAENQTRKLCSSWLVNILITPSVNLCYNLCSCPDAPAGDPLPKMFMQGINQDHSLYSLKFAQYAGVGDGDEGVKCQKEITPPDGTATLVTVPPLCS